MAARLADAAAAVFFRVRPAVVAVTGGETAVALLRAVGASRLEIRGAPASGLALGVAMPDGGEPIPLLTKAGGFGPPDLFTAFLASTDRHGAVHTGAATPRVI